MLGHEARRGQQLHERFDREETVQGSSDRSFGLVFAFVFAILGGLKLWAGRPGAAWWLAAAAAFLAVVLAKPALLGPLNRLWLRLGLAMYAVINPVVMGILFYGCVTPIGVLMRTLGKNPLRLSFDRNVRSYWIRRDPPGPAPDTMRQQF
jgi:Saxitoxin biosynthesis operon protein SxtJ